ncbi:piwi-like protein 2 [Tetranychus urticae]|nr:piwi-like protein 2 [Tetranychus urticae]
MKLAAPKTHQHNPLVRIYAPAHKVWLGYLHVCAIKEYDGVLGMNIDCDVRRKTTALDILREHSIDQINILLLGAIVLTRYSNRAYRIDDIDFERNALSKYNQRNQTSTLFDSTAGKFAPEKLAFGGGNEISAANEAEWGLNIAMQMACKQGGHDHNHITYHDPSDEARSVFGVVPSMNRNATRWYSHCFFQNQREEIVNNLGLAITAALKKYYEVNGIIPGKIFFYRGGVGDDDVPIVREYEIPQLETALINYVKNKPELTKPQLSFIVVQKRVKITHINGRNLLNLPPGSVINHTDTRRQFYDFYLVSQHVHHGVSTTTITSLM